MKEPVPNAKKSEVASPTISAEDKNIPLTPEQALLAQEAYKDMKETVSVMFNKSHNIHFHLSDFISWGTEGLIEAAKNHDPSQGATFLTYAKYIIRGRILDHIRSANFLSRFHVKFLKDHADATEFLTKKLEREPKKEEIAEKMGLTLTKYLERLQKYPINAQIISLSGAKKVDGELLEGDDFLDFLLHNNNPYSPNFTEEYRQEEMGLLNKFLDQLNLSEKEIGIFKMYFYDGMGSKEIGEKFGLTEARISQIRTKVIEDLRKLFEKEGYKVNRDNWRFGQNKNG